MRQAAISGPSPRPWIRGVGPAPAVFGDDGVDMAVLDHHRIVEHRHVGHAAVGMARVEIVAEQRILLRRSASARVMAPTRSALARRTRRCVSLGLEIVDQHPHRHAAAAVLAGRAVGDRLRAAEAGLGQHVVERGGALADEMGEDFALHHPRQIGAWRGRRQIELRGVPHLARQTRPLLAMPTARS